MIAVGVGSGSAGGGVMQVTANAVTGRALDEGLWVAVVSGGVTGGVGGTLGFGVSKSEVIMDPVVERFSNLSIGDQGIDRIVIDLVEHRTIVKIDKIWILPNENPVWDARLLAGPNAQLVFVRSVLVTIYPEDSALDGLILTWSATSIEQRERSWRSAQYRFEFLIVGSPTPVTLRIEADDFYVATGDNDIHEASGKRADPSI